jgi:SNF2 family DNA or RNA helicase
MSPNKNKGSATICRNGPEGALHKKFLTPFSNWHITTPALQLAPADVHGYRGQALEIPAPETFAALLPPPQVRTVGCLFPDGKQTKEELARNLAEGAVNRPSIPANIPEKRAKPDGNHGNSTERSPQSPTSRTRIRPPQDIVKLEDRLYFLLQPPLEDLLRNESLTFPFRPFEYQMDGIAFLYPRHQAVLADEMGLGKTMQAVTALRLLFNQGEIGRALLVCPKPLVSNWKHEFNLWAPELPITIIEGNAVRRQWLWQRATEGILLANYESVVRDRKHIESIHPPFDCLVLDESQRIKNSDSTTNRVVCSIPRQRSWALTGTPIENSTEDLVGIFQFVAPGTLRPQMKPTAMRPVVDDYVIRRTKDLVMNDLPPKLYRDANIQLTDEQWHSYQLAENEGIVRLSKMECELTIHHVFELVLRLKQICNFDPLTGASAKFDRLKADLEECASSGRKAIVFSQWVQTLNRLRDELSAYNPLEYHGQIPSRKRDGVIEQFRDDPSRHVLLMSYGAGSVGLNLQFAGYVFLFDRWWNPAVEDQAINRAHRVGTIAPVTITRMLATGTIEDRIDRILQDKRELFSSIFDQAPSIQSSGLSRDEIFGLFNLKFPGS